MTTTTHPTARRAATTVLLAGAAVLVAAPAFAGVPPEDTGSAGRQTNAQAGIDDPSAKTRVKLEQMEREMRDRMTDPQPASDPSDPSSVPVTVLALLGGSLVAGAAGFTVYRFRHHGPISAATA
jgi:hypothetical protein